MSACLELTREEMLRYLNEINRKLKADGKHGEIVLAGGAALALVFNARNSTRDIDAIFAPTHYMNAIIAEIADENENLSYDWLNDGVKRFVTDRMNYSDFLTLSNLTIYSIDAEGLLAMKLTAHRVDSKDMDDSIFLMKVLDISTVSQTLDIVEKYTHKSRQTPETRVFAIEVFERYQAEKTTHKQKSTKSDFRERLEAAKGVVEAHNQQTKKSPRQSNEIKE